MHANRGLVFWGVALVTAGAVALAIQSNLIAADAARDALEAGSVADPASWGEVNLLKQRVEQLVDRADADQAALLERVNAPFVEASAAVLDDPEHHRERDGG